MHVIGSFAELAERSGRRARATTTARTSTSSRFPCPRRGRAAAERDADARVPEVIDVWFDSGSMPFAQHHYPFENEDGASSARFPADFICEAQDQTRGWFYSLLAVATLLGERRRSTAGRRTGTSSASA